MRRWFLSHKTGLIATQISGTWKMVCVNFWDFCVVRSADAGVVTWSNRCNIIGTGAALIHILYLKLWRLHKNDVLWIITCILIFHIMVNPVPLLTGKEGWGKAGCSALATPRRSIDENKKSGRRAYNKPLRCGRGSARTSRGSFRKGILLFWLRNKVLYDLTFFFQVEFDIFL